MRFELREQTPWWLTIGAPVGAVLFSLLFASVLIAWAGEPVFSSLFLMFKGGYGSSFALTETLARATPLMFTGLAAAVAFKARFWNIGAEGQLYCGALCAVWLGTGLLELPPLLMVSVLFSTGALAGAALLLFPVFLKSRLNVDEVVTTLLLNFVVLLVVSYFLEGPMKDPMSLGWPQSASIIDAGVLEPLIPRSRVHSGLLFALAASVLIWWLLRYSRWGFETRAFGINASAAQHAGVSANTTILHVALLSGGLAGMAGVSEVAGLKGYLTLDLSPGFGYTGIAVAMLANLHPIGVIVSAVFLASIYIGADSMSRQAGIPSYIADIVVATSVLSVLVGLMFARYRVWLK